MGGEGASRPPGKLNVKIGPPLVDILIFSILKGLICWFFAFSGCFLIFNWYLHPRHPEILYHFITFIWVLARGPLQLSFAPPLAQISSCATACGPHEHSKCAASENGSPKLQHSNVPIWKSMINRYLRNSMIERQLVKRSLSYST